MTFDEFVAARLPALLRYAAVLTGDRDLAQDVVQDVLLRAHRRWSSIHRLEVPEQYVRRMILNEFLSWRRRWGRVLPVAEVTTELLADLPERRQPPPTLPPLRRIAARG